MEFSKKMVDDRLVYLKSHCKSKADLSLAFRKMLSSDLIGWLIISNPGIYMARSERIEKQLQIIKMELTSLARDLERSIGIKPHDLVIEILNKKLSEIEEAPIEMYDSLMFNFDLPYEERNHDLGDGSILITVKPSARTSKTIKPLLLNHMDILAEKILIGNNVQEIYEKAARDILKHNPCLATILPKSYESLRKFNRGGKKASKAKSK